MVIEETATLYREMLSVKGWEQKYGEEFIVDHLNRIPQKSAFLVIARCGFDARIPWVGDTTETNNSNVSFGEALKGVLESIIPRLLLPA
ncbi:hypothetical protein QCA50_005009 [Cerrena zonata]|uniref:Uncharacterized protein n=1 Tax=Cerrena zonata TaxID=2478898 RepID=A0AAW0GKH7_9APHY